MKALSLLSGGLDSVLASKFIIEQNIEVEAVYFHNPFCDCSLANSSCKVSQKAADFLKIPFHQVELKEEYLDMVRNPQYGYGKNINPCIDCRILQFKTAKELMKRLGAAFIVTGEVLNERPMSQRKRIIEMMDKTAGLEGLILRPLSAKRLKETCPEKEGLVDRERLLDIEGRSRKIQMELAARFGIEEYPTPSGGCLLTYSGFSDKVRDLIRHNQLTLGQVRLLKLGRHFRLTDTIKFIIGRDKEENRRLLEYKDIGAVFLKAKDFPGPIGFMLGGVTKASLELAGSILAYYINKADSNQKLRIDYWQNGARAADSMMVSKIAVFSLDKLRITR